MINFQSHFTKRLILVILFFTFTPLALITTLVSVFSIQKSSTAPTLDPVNVSRSTNSGVRVYASLPNSLPEFSQSVEIADARVHIIRKYLEKFNSPLAPYSELIVSTADKYNIDWRLITAIARQESNLCKIIPPNTYNCYGWGIHSRGTLGFKSFEEGIDIVSKGLKKEYIDKGYKTPDKIMTKYTPSSNGSWALGVNTFISEMQ